ncbi:restriction endonuclease [Dysgonomonas sp. 216]|uniref:PmeII family type II restriction endonuclease n=1 Tax=Dysgonomonas sp. 216 TaxID=2302934 RepID=UPI0013D33895|nr:PmeII family type II restriction endonuclease [Dysgonomonas sp. 216]NDW19824.1 restriction endonuclease [Dysgonomonas sp. 216]
MTEAEKQEILTRAKTFFIDNIVANHNNGLEKASHLSSYNPNPFLASYLAQFIGGDNSSTSIAKALIYPRVLGTSINTIFGNQVQRMMSTIFAGFASTTAGIDIEFIDSTDNRRKYCQLKSGPNTINRDDVTTIKNHFRGVRNLARTNHLNINIDDMIVGVLYGDDDSLSGHYKDISKEYPVYVGQDFWTRLTGDEDFYNELIDVFAEAAEEIDSREALENAINNLASEIDDSDIF